MHLTQNSLHMLAVCVVLNIYFCL